MRRIFIGASALALSFAPTVHAPEAVAKGPPKHVYVVLDTGIAYQWAGTVPEAEANAVAIMRGLRTLPARRYKDATFTFLDTVQGKAFWTGSYKQLGKIEREAYLTAASPKEVCADFTQLFEKLRFRLKRDRAADAVLVMSSPLYDVPTAFCEDEATERPRPPVAFKDAYRLDELLADPALKRVVMVGGIPEQEAALFEHVAPMEGAGKVTFTDTASLPAVIREMHGAY